MSIVDTAGIENDSCRAEALDRAPGSPLKVLYLISNLEYGGAQCQVVALTNGLNAAGTEAYVCCLSDYVPLAREVNDAARRLYVLAKRGKFDAGVVPRIEELLGKLDIDVLHTFLFDAEIAGRLAGRLGTRAAVIGSERNTDYKRKWRHSVALRLTSRCVDAIIANSNAGKRFQMRTLGIDSRKIFVVHNGVDTAKFRPLNGGGLRSHLGIPHGAGVVAMFSSFKKQKNHPMFLRMVRRVRDVHPEARFLCVGDELHGGLQASDRYRAKMLTMIESLGLGDVLMCLGNRDDVVDLYNVCDATVLTSRREGTPNVLLESMACGVPVVATDVADNRLIVPHGQVGYIVPDDDDRAMAEHVLRLLRDADLRDSLGRAARSWVERGFTIPRLLHDTFSISKEVVRRKVKASAG